MREIKFRAFDIGKGCFIDVLQFTFNTPTTDWKIYGFTDEDVLMRGGNNDIILMQYTGLKDKNGVEIYEGDIVTVSAAASGERSFEYRGSVVFEEFEYCVETTENNWPIISWKCVEKCEVIGNIYENPELLE